MLALPAATVLASLSVAELHKLAKGRVTNYKTYKKADLLAFLVAEAEEIELREQEAAEELPLTLAPKKHAEEVLNTPAPRNLTVPSTDAEVDAQVETAKAKKAARRSDRFSHAECDHPATKAGRAKCRRGHK